MLIDDFYIINDISFDSGVITAKISFNEKHDVFKGHFPEQPVVPGVIQLQIIRELTEQHLHNKLAITNLNQVKYLTPIIPNETIIDITITLKENNSEIVRADALVSDKQNVYTKIKVDFEVRS